ncbi:cytochrome b/b6 domain-containing protein [Chloroflexota bacterium]
MDRYWCWGKDDLKWFFAAPGYYFGGSVKNMPHQNRLNTGQKLWQLVLFGTAIMFLITGSVIWLFRSAIAINIYEWILFFHGMAFVILLSMLLLHLYMSVLHPRMRGSFYSMIDGKVSSTYARKHHRKWYEEIMQEKADGDAKASEDLSS